MREPALALRLVEAVVAAVGDGAGDGEDAARLGRGSLNAAEIAARAEAAGVAMVTVHGRTRCQFYEGRADWAAIAAVKRAVTIPVIANGDIGSVGDARRALALSGADGVMIGRGAARAAVADRAGRGRARRAAGAGGARGRGAGGAGGRPGDGRVLRSRRRGAGGAQAPRLVPRPGAGRRRLRARLLAMTDADAVERALRASSRRSPRWRRQHERAARPGNDLRRFEALWGAIPYPALVVDAADAIVTANPATESFGATSVRQMTGKPLGKFVGGDSAVLDVVGQARRNGVSVAQYDVMVGWADQRRGCRTSTRRRCTTGRRDPDPDASAGHGRQDGPQPRAPLGGALGHRHGGDAGARDPQPARRHLGGGAAPGDGARRRRPRADRPDPGRGGAHRQAGRPGRAVRRPAARPAAAQHPRRARPGTAAAQAGFAAHVRFPRTSTPRCRRPRATRTSCCRCSRTCSRTPPRRCRGSAGRSGSPPPTAGVKMARPGRRASLPLLVTSPTTGRASRRT